MKNFVATQLFAWLMLGLAGCSQNSSRGERDMNKPHCTRLMDKSPGWSMTFAPDGARMFFTGQFEGHIGAWDLKNGKQVSNLGDKHYRGTFFRFADRGQTILSGGNGQIMRWSVQGDQTVCKKCHEFPEDVDKYSTVIGLSADGNKAILESKTAPMKIWSWDLPNQRTELIYDAAKSPVFGNHRNACAFSSTVSPDQKRIALIMDVRFVVIDDSGKELSVSKQDGDYVRDLILYTPDGQLLSFDDRITLHKTDSAEAEKQSEVYRDANGKILIIRTGSISADGRYFAGGMSWANCKPGYVVLWDIKNWKQLAFFQASDGNLARVQISPDGSTIATDGSDDIVNLWDIKDLIEAAKK
jgi:WD40 repeat protein